MGICIRSIKNFRAKFSVFTAPETHSVYMHSSLSYIDTERERDRQRERQTDTEVSERERERTRKLYFTRILLYVLSKTRLTSAC